MSMHTLAERVPLMRLLELVYRISPAVGRMTTRAWYQYMTRLDRQAEMTFMNYGYVPLNGTVAPRLHQHDEPHRLSIQLYHHVASLISISDKDVLEVGCGRGGGASYMARYLRPRSLTGVDIADAAVRFCNDFHRHPRLGFVHADAVALPFPNRSFDVIVNVESSHCYSSMRRFLGEVHRCLRPGGRFLFADRRESRSFDLLRSQIRLAQFEIAREHDITRNVVQALDLDDERKQARIEADVPWLMRKVFKQFAATKGTSLHRAFRTGAWEYRSFLLAPNGS